MLKPFALRASLDDRHPLVAAWRFIEPMLFGQVYTNKRAIASHYNADPKMFLSFLDPVFPAYSQGVYAHDDEPLAKAIEARRLREPSFSLVHSCPFLGTSTR